MNKRKIFLTSAIGGNSKVNGNRIATPLFWYNGFTERLKNCWKDNSKVMIFSGSPNYFDKNDSVVDCLRQSFPMSGLSIATMEICDSRNAELVSRIQEMDAIILFGGHVPSQNAFFHKIGLKEHINKFDGVIITVSAGSMNSAEIVYAGPELDGEAIDPNYQRWLPGLGLTDINIYPHYDDLKDDYLDGMRLMEDITYPDSFKHEIIALNNGSYILIANDVETIYGEAYLIKDGRIKQICEHGNSIVL